MIGLEPAGSGFNPTLVRLRTHDHPDGIKGQQQFQSHAGSIEAVILVAGGNPDVRFNPTLVRLRRAVAQERLGQVHVVSIPRWFD